MAKNKGTGISTCQGRLFMGDSNRGTRGDFSGAIPHDYGFDPSTRGRVWGGLLTCSYGCRGKKRGSILVSLINHALSFQLPGFVLHRQLVLLLGFAANRLADGLLELFLQQRHLNLGIRQTFSGQPHGEDTARTRGTVH